MLTSTIQKNSLEEFEAFAMMNNFRKGREFTQTMYYPNYVVVTFFAAKVHALWNSYVEILLKTTTKSPFCTNA